MFAHNNVEIVIRWYMYQRNDGFTGFCSTAEFNMLLHYVFSLLMQNFKIDSRSFSYLKFFI